MREAYRIEQTPRGYVVTTGPETQYRREETARDWAALAVVIIGFVVICALV